MKITEIVNDKTPSLSFEVFPPKTSDKYENISNAVKEIAVLNKIKNMNIYEMNPMEAMNALDELKKILK